MTGNDLETVVQRCYQHARQLIDSEEQAVFDDLTLDKVFQVKAMCDAYFMHALRKSAEQKLK